MKQLQNKLLHRRLRRAPGVRNLLFIVKELTGRTVFSGLLALLCLAFNMTQATADEPIRLRVLSYNIHHAEGVDRKLDVERISRIVLSVKPDLVALQEVDQKATRTGGIDQAAKLAELTNLEYVFGANIELLGGHYGNAVLSRFPISNHVNHLLPNLNKGEQRGVIAAELAIPGRTDRLLFLATHLDHRADDRERIKSAKAINALVTANANQPALLAGDMNDIVGSPTLSEFDSKWLRTSSEPMPTIPVQEPQRQFNLSCFVHRISGRCLKSKCWMKPSHPITEQFSPLSNCNRRHM